MSATRATYAFLPWLRRGMAARVERRDGAGAAAPRAAVPVTIGLDAAGERRAATAALELQGPGEVAALDPRTIIRTVPKPEEADAQPNVFPAVEFAQADLPWRFTPARADAARGRLRPWLVLVALAADEISEEAAGGEGGLASITVAEGSSLPRLDQSWAWAHVQVDGFDAGGETLGDVIRHTPHRARSRVLAPRRLEPRTAYRCFLVPAFERGRLTGLGEDVPDAVDGLAPAWTPPATAIRLPVYHAWSFQTGERGDFESLSRRLQAREVDAGVGARDMDVGAADPALPAAASGPLALEGALVAPAATSTPWPAAQRGPFVDALAELLNRQTEALGPGGTPLTVTPPLWARWQAAADRLLTTSGARPAWFHELNADPRLRAAAGLGAEVVRRNDQQLMAEAWRQVEGIVEANAELRRSQVSREASERLLDRHLATLSTETFLTVTAPLHPRFTLSPSTVHETLRRSPVPDGALDGGARRALRPGGRIARRVDRLRATDAARAPLLDRLNRGDVRARAPAETPSGLVTRRRAAAAVGVEPPAERRPRRVRPASCLLWVLAAVLLLLGLVSRRLRERAAAVLAAAAAAAGARRPEEEAAATDVGPRVAHGPATPEDVREAQPARGFVPVTAVLGSWSEPAPQEQPVEPEAATRFRDALAELVGELDAAPARGPQLVVADLPAVATRLTAQMHPARTIADGIAARLHLADWVTWEFDDPLEPIMAAPHIETPMYEPLCELGQDWLMPGVEQLEPDTVTLLRSNQRFIEAYMAGLSHEMARELLYHEFPTDQRGTYFRQFWDVRGAVGAPDDPEARRDVKAIHTWRRANPLGANTGRQPPPREGHLVLLVKGEVLRRYPNTLVYALRAALGSDGRRTLGTQQAFPVFEGRLDPDVSFFGFDLLPSEARGRVPPAPDQGWYFVLQEQPTEPVFGLDADDGLYASRPTSWNDLNWSQLAEDEDALRAVRHIDLDADLPDTRVVTAPPGGPTLAWHAEAGRGPAGANGSDIAHITLQRPFRVAIHGSDMLPPEAP